MNPEQFAYWLQGRLEGRNLAEYPLTLDEQTMIQLHLALVFVKATSPTNRISVDGLGTGVNPVPPVTLLC